MTAEEIRGYLSLSTRTNEPALASERDALIELAAQVAELNTYLHKLTMVVALDPYTDDQAHIRTDYYPSET